MAHWTLQSRANSSWMFQPAERRIQGFRCTHQLSAWLGDYGHATRTVRPPPSRLHQARGSRLPDIPGSDPPVWEAYVLRFSDPWTGTAFKPSKDSSLGTVLFPAALRALTIQIATSFLSFEQAERNLHLELGTTSPEPCA